MQKWRPKKQRLVILCCMGSLIFIVFENLSHGMCVVMAMADSCNLFYNKFTNILLTCNFVLKSVKLPTSRMSCLCSNAGNAYSHSVLGNCGNCKKSSIVFKAVLAEINEKFVCPRQKLMYIF